MATPRWRDRVQAVLEIHNPVLEEIEVYCLDGVGSPDLCLSYDDCPGHITAIQVCAECGYTYSDETVGYRGWPCPTVRALDGRP